MADFDNLIEIFFLALGQVVELNAITPLYNGREFKIPWQNISVDHPVRNVFEQNILAAEDTVLNGARCVRQDIDCVDAHTPWAYVADFTHCTVGLENETSFLSV